ncbi:MAG: sigma-70 family RNA polymerase sigma factor [Planctomycetales bacterium]|nr:sigma-70 family RNA polymerase sigma factor [Planctomycetales bacterium]
MSDATEILSQIERGDPSSAEELFPLVYTELRELARAKMFGERADHTLGATALVHEAYVRLVDQNAGFHWQSRGHFFRAAAESMRRILVEHARSKRRLKRGGDRFRIGLDQLEPATASDVDQVLSVNEVLDVLAERDPQAAEFIKLRYFAGFSVQETAQLLGVSVSTAYAHWAFAKGMIGNLLAEYEPVDQ